MADNSNLTKDPVFNLLYNTYNQNPNVFSVEDVDNLKYRAKELGVQFEPQTNDFNLTRSIKQAFDGFISGFTTLQVGDQPRNEVEALFHNIGNLAGFIGWVPGAGSLAKIASVGFSRGIARFMEKELADKIAKGIVDRGITGLSLPMLGSDWIMKGASSFITKNAALESIKFLKEGSAMRDILQSGTHLAIASAISAAPSIPVVDFNLALKDRLDALMGGFEAGAAFGLIGNTISTNVVKGFGEKLGISPEVLDDQTKLRALTAASRATTAAMYMGLPSTLRGEPSLMQVYQYVSGAAFGLATNSVHERYADEFVRGYSNDAGYYKLWNVFSDKPTIPGWDKLTPEAQELVKASVEFSHGRLVNTTDDYLKNNGLDTITEGGVIVNKALDAALSKINEDLRSGAISPGDAGKYAFALEHARIMQSKESSGMSSDQAFAEAGAEVSKTMSKAQQVADEFVKLGIKTQLQNDALSVSDTFLSDDVRREISDVVKENGADPRFINPFYDAARSIQQKENIVGEGEFRKNVIKDMLVESTKADNVEDFLKKISAKYGDLGDEQTGKLKQVWLTVNDSFLRQQRTVSNTGAIDNTNEFNKDGIRNTQASPHSYLDDVLWNVFGDSQGAIYVNSGYDGKSSKGLYDIIDVYIKDKSALPGFLQSAFKENLMVHGGVKDKDRIVMAKSIVKAIGSEPDENGRLWTRFQVGDNGPQFTLKEKLDVAQEALDGLNEEATRNAVATGSTPKLYDKAHDVFDKNLAEYVSVFRDSNRSEYSGMSDDQIFRMFEKNYAHNIAMLEQLNGDGKDVWKFMPFEQIIAAPENFITTLDKYNKRQQIVNAGEHKVDPSYFPYLPGHPQAPNERVLNYVVIDSKNAISELGPLYAYEMKGGVPQRVQTNTHLDGIFLVRNDIFDSILDFAGFDKNSGHQKGTLVHSDPGEGMIIGKFAYHRADPELDKRMMEENIHMHMYDTAVKQLGFRYTNGLRYNPVDGYQYVKNHLDRLDVYQLPVSKLTVNFSASERGESALKDQKAVVQLYSNLNASQVSPAVIEDAYNWIKSLGMDGNAEHNGKANAYIEISKGLSKIDNENIKAQLDKLADEIDVPKLGFAEVLKILKGEYIPSSKLYDKMMRHILKLDKEGEFQGNDDGVVDAETDALDRSLDTSRAGANRIFDTVTEITPSLVEAHPSTSRYAQSVITSYLMKMVKRPTVPYSMKAVMSPYQLAMQGKYNLKPGEYMLDTGMKDKMVLFHTEPGVVTAVRLEDAYNEYKKNPTTERADDLKHAVVRVPADSMSGIRMLDFKGFTDIKGYGILLHPEDMKNLGGADLDIDSAFIFTSMPASMKAAYGKPESMYEWYKWYKYDESSNQFVADKNGKPIEVAPGDKTGRAVFQPSKQSMRDIIAKESPNIDAIKGHPISIANPMMTIKQNEDTYQANKILGPGLYHTRRLQTIFKHDSKVGIRVRNEEVLNYLEAKAKQLSGKNGSVRAVYGIFGNDARPVREATRDIVNFGADADGHYIPLDDINSLTLDRAFKSMSASVKFDDGSTMNLPFTAKELVDNHKGEDPFFLAFGMQDYADLQKLDKGMRGYDFNMGRKMSIEEIIYGTGDSPGMSAVAGKYDKVNNVFYRLANEFAKRGKQAMPSSKHEVFGSNWRGLYTSKKFKPGLKADLSKWIMSQDPLAQTLRDFSFRRFVNIAANENYQPWAQSQDAMDWTTLLAMRKYGEAAVAKGHTLEQMKDIALQIDNFKRTWSILRKSTEDIGQMADEYQSKSLNHSELYKEITDSFKKWYSESKELGDFASAWYTGSLYAQTVPYHEYMRPYSDAYGKLTRKLQSVSSENKTELVKQIDAAKKEIKRAHHRWEESNATMMGVNSSFVPDYIIRDYFDGFSDLVGASWKPSIEKEDIQDINMRTRKGASAQMQEVQPNSIAFNQSSRVVGIVNQGEVQRFRESFWKNLPHIAKMDIDARYAKLTTDLADLLYKYPQLIPHFNEKLFGNMSELLGRVSVTPDAISIEQLQLALDNFKKTFQQDEKGYPLKRRHAFMPPQLLNDKHLPYDAHEFVYQVVPTITGVGGAEATIRDMPVRTFMSTFEQMRLVMNASDKMESSMKDQITRRFKNEFSTYYALGVDAHPIYVAVTQLRERGRGRESAEATSYYEEEARKGEDVLAKYKDHPGWNVPTDKGTRHVTLDQVVEEFKNISNFKAEYLRKRYIYNEAFDSYRKKSLAGRTDLTPEEHEISQYVSFDKNGFIDRNRTFAYHKQAMIEQRYSQIPILGHEFFNRLTWELQLSKMQIIDGNGNPFRPIDAKSEADRSAMMKYILDNPDINKNGKLDYKSMKDQYIFYDEYFPHLGHPQSALRKSLKDKLERMRAMGYGEDAIQKAEMEGKNEIERLNAPDAKMIEDVEEVFGKDITDPEKIGEAGLRAIPGNLQSRAQQGGPIPGYDKSPFAWFDYEHKMAKSYFKRLESWVNYELMERFKKEQPFGKDTPAWAAFMDTYRRDNLGLPSLFPKEWLDNKSFYIKNNPYYYFTDQAVWDAYQRIEKKLGPFSKDINWDNYREIIHNNGGFGQIGTERNLASRDLHKMGVLETLGTRIDVMGRDGKKEAILVHPGASKRNIMDGFKRAEADGIPIFFRDQFDKNLVPKKKEPNIDYQKLSEARWVSAQLARLSVMEGKYNLISLLSHTKTMLGNITTGYTNTAISTGLGTLARAKDLNYIMRIMPEIKSKDDLNKFRESSGALESYIKQEFGENITLNENLKQFVNEGVAILQKDPNAPDLTFMELAKKYKMGQEIVDKAAWFMRTAEVALRGDSWMAHYLHGREVLEANGYIFKDNNHPWLIRMANKGVETTQFLYNNANKPAFARTSLGRIYFRFQQWALQSILMRKEIFQRAGNVNLKPGSNEYKRLQNLIVADLFALGLAILFPATFFDTTVAPPLQQMQDLSDWFFGDARERQHSFFGQIPYPYNMMNPLIPPIGRIPTSIFGSMLTGDWDKFSSYTMWTMFPFGRIGRDIKKTIEAPTMIIENMTNLPIHQFERQHNQEISDRERRSPKQMFHSFIRDAFNAPLSGINPQ